ncbi:MAG: hypothetical protein BWY31_01818 [Lentisphaerae bacterium ADurb.Bin242]|nr:MAG: hypothetical protein BWY31_01818 [Lentisphaerae bacterium ADurb.Bin242]
MSLKYRFRQIKKFPDWFFWFPAKFLLLLRRVMRTEIIDDAGSIAAKNPPAITVLWHNRLLFFPAMFDRWERDHTVAVISASRDGEYIADLCRQFGIESVRGSTSRKAVQVLVGAMKSILMKRKYVSFTPDGPRGPKYVMSRGPIHLASETGVRIIPIAVNYSSYWELKSWDGFQIPKPWAKITMRLGEPVSIPPNLKEEELERWRLEVQNRLNAITVDRKRRSAES